MFACQRRTCWLAKARALRLHRGAWARAVFTTARGVSAWVSVPWKPWSAAPRRAAHSASSWLSRYGVTVLRCVSSSHAALPHYGSPLTCTGDTGACRALQASIQMDIARSRIEIDCCRQLVLDAARKIDTVGSRGARKEIAMIKVFVPSAILRVLDRAIQAFGGAGVSQDTFLAQTYAGMRTLRVADGERPACLRVGLASLWLTHVLCACRPG